MTDIPAPLPSPVTGRFAPSPTGPLHMGSLVTAVASYLDIKQKGGAWHVRIDDLDPPRQDPNAVQAIQATLSAHGLLADKPVYFQSTQQQRYRDFMAQLAGQLFYCNCTRKALQAFRTYPGRCRQHKSPRPDCARRIEINRTQSLINYTDQILGPVQADLTSTYGDFIVKRRDGLWAYNFATAVDDGADYSHVLRGQDLTAVTAPQIYIMHRLALSVPSYTHIPMLCYANGDKLSKQTHAPAVNNRRPLDNLLHVLTLLGQNPPANPNWQVQECLAWAIAHWQINRVPASLPAYEHRP